MKELQGISPKYAIKMQQKHSKDHNGQIISYEEYFPFGGSSFTAGRSQKELNFSTKTR